MSDPAGAPSRPVSTEGVVIERATAEDAAAVSEFAARMFAETFAAQNSAEDMALYLAQAFSPERQAEEIADPRGGILVVRVAGELAGFAHLGEDPPSVRLEGASPLEVRRFYVGPAWQGRGLAQRLMAAVDEEARARGRDVLWLGVWEHNARAIAFYRKVGFRVVGEQEFVLGTDRQRDLVMARPVPTG